ncbi:adenine deaminase [Ligilactobacillus sp. LYQ135]
MIVQTVDLKITSNHVLNVFSRTFEPNVLWINDGKIVATGKQPALIANSTLDYSDKYLVPGFIDAHVHIESSLVKPSELGKLLLQQGTTSIFADPHEIANVYGTYGIDYMLSDAENSPLNTFIMLPSCVPCTNFEHNYEKLNSSKLLPYYENAQVRGLAELMDFPAVANRDQDMLQKIADCLNHNRQIDGHGAGLSRYQLDIFRQNHISTDHECTTPKQVLDRINEGFFVFLREGTVERDLDNIISVVNESNAQRFAFCTDDKLINTLIDEGGINFCIKQAIQHGVQPETAYTMASYNAALAHQTPHIGALSTNYNADIVVLDDYHTVKVNTVIKDGLLLDQFSQLTKPSTITNSMNYKLTKKQLELPIKTNKAHVIEIIPNHIETKHSIINVPTQNHLFIPNTQQDLLKIVVVERHHQLGTVGVGIVHGFKLKNGAVASTIAHDSHNIIAVGTNDDDIFAAINHLGAVNGGITLFNHQKEIATMPLPIAGLMSDKPYQQAVEELNQITATYHQLSDPIDFDPFITLSFLALPVIPTLKITDQGLYDFDQQKFISVETEA